MQYTGARWAWRKCRDDMCWTECARESYRSGASARESGHGRRLRAHAEEGAVRTCKKGQHTHQGTMCVRVRKLRAHLAATGPRPPQIWSQFSAAARAPAATSVPRGPTGPARVHVCVFARAHARACARTHTHVRLVCRTAISSPMIGLCTGKQMAIEGGPQRAWAQAPHPPHTHTATASPTHLPTHVLHARHTQAPYMRSHFTHAPSHACKQAYKHTF